MGADLYIHEINRPLMQKYQPLFDQAVQLRNSFPRGSKEAEEAQKEVSKYYDLMYSEGYFRDSYNGSNVLNRLGLSWWQDVIPLCTEDKELKGNNLARFREMVATAELALPSKKELEEGGAPVAEEGEDSLAEWHKYFAEKRQELLAFLDQAIALNTAIYCSL